MVNDLGPAPLGWVVISLVASNEGSGPGYEPSFL